VDLDPPYTLGIAGASLHWMDPEQAFDTFASVLEPGAVLALVDGDAPHEAPWAEAEQAVHRRTIERMSHKPSFGSNKAYRPPDPERPVFDHPRFLRRGHEVFFHTFSQSPDEYVDALHSRQSFCLEAMGPKLAAQFDAEVREVLAPHIHDGCVSFRLFTRLEWGEPH
jgi:SAM-dependent methyltransferase